MKKIYILALEHSVLQAIAGTQYCFDTINGFREQAGQQPLFNVQLLGLKSPVFPNDSKFSITRGIVLQDDQAGFKVNVIPIIEFLRRTEKNGQVMRNFDVVQTLLRHYIHQDNFIQYKKVSQFIQDIETALYDYQNS